MINIFVLVAIFLPAILAPFVFFCNKYKKAPLFVSSILIFISLCIFVYLQISKTIITIEFADICLFTIQFKLTDFRLVYDIITSFMWFCSSLFSIEYMYHDTHIKRYSFFLLLTYTFTICIFVSDNLFTTYLFFELMSLSSYPWIIHNHQKSSLKAGKTYIYIAIIGGLSILMGFFLLPADLITISFSDISTYITSNSNISASLLTPSILMLVGFGAKAGVFPLHVWLPKAHPVSPAPLSALLSGVLTKTGIFGTIILSVYYVSSNTIWGNLIVVLGTATMLVGALLALMSNNIKRILACSSMSQIGFIFIAIGIYVLLPYNKADSALAIVYHMVNHSVLKLLLFTLAGIIAININSVYLSDAAGFGKNKPLLHIAFLSGMLGISGFPLFNGFISKTLIHESLSEYVFYLSSIGNNIIIFEIVEWLFTIAGGLTLAYMLKIYVCVFLKSNDMFKTKQNYMSKLTTCVVVIASIIPILLGILHQIPIGVSSLTCNFFNTNRLEHIHIFSLETILSFSKSFIIGIIIFIIVQKHQKKLYFSTKTQYPDLQPSWLNLEENVYIPIIKVLKIIGFSIAKCISNITDSLVYIVKNIVQHSKPAKKYIPWSNKVTYFIGSILDFFTTILNKTVLRKRPIKTKFVYVLAASNEEFQRQSRKLTRSISFGLLMFSIGLVATIAYLLLYNI